MFVIVIHVLQFKPQLPYGHMFTLTKLELRKPQTESRFPYIHNQWETIYTVLPHCVIYNQESLYSSIAIYKQKYLNSYTQSGK